MGGWSLEGISTLLEHVQVPVHVQHDELPWVERTTGVGADDLVGHSSGDVVRVGEVGIELIHTPGHTPGSQCFLVDGQARRRRHTLLGRLRPYRLPRVGPARHVRVPPHQAGPRPRRGHLVPGSHVLRGRVRQHGRDPTVELRLPAAHSAGVDGHVRRVTPPGRAGTRRYGGRRRRLAGRLARRRDPARRGLRGHAHAGGSRAAPALRPPPAVQAGARRNLAAREGGVGRPPAFQRAAGARDPRARGGPARRRRAGGRARRRLDRARRWDRPRHRCAAADLAGDRFARPVRRALHAAHPR